MKNVIVYGLIIGILSVIWMFVMRALGFYPDVEKINSVEFVSILIPLIGLYFGVKSYRDKERGGKIGFFDALFQGFKILLLGGVISVSAAIIYIEEFTPNRGLEDFSARIFGALLVGVLFALGTAALFTTRHNKLD